MEKFGKNKYHIINKSGQELTLEYLKVFIASYCRGDLYQHNREANMDFLVSDEFLAGFTNRTVSEVCAAAKSHECWGDRAQVQAPAESRELSMPMTVKRGGVFYRLVQGTGYWVAEVKSNVGWRPEEWLMLASRSQEDAYAAFQKWLDEFQHAKPVELKW